MRQSPGAEQDFFKSLLQSSDPTFVLSQADEAEQHSPWTAVAAARAAGLLRNWQLAADWAEQGLALDSDDVAAVGWLHYYGGTAAMYLGDPGRSRRELLRLQELAADRSELTAAIPQGLFNLGILHRLQQEFDAQIACFRRAAELFERQGRHARAQLCRVEIAWSYLLQGYPDLALPELEAVESDLGGCQDEDLQHDYRLSTALYCSLQGNIRQSQELCTSLFDEPGLSPGRRADALWIKATNCRASGKREEAARLAEEARHYARMDFWAPQLDRIDALRESLRAS